MDFEQLHSVVQFAASQGPFSNLSDTTFAAVRRVRQAPVLQHLASFKKLLLARWRLSDPSRLRLAEVGVEVQAWPHQDNPAEREVGHRRLVETVNHLARLLSSLWDKSFADVFAPFLLVMEATPNVAERYSTIYLVSRLERALSFFAESVFDRQLVGASVDIPPNVAKPPSAWAEVLRAAVVRESTTELWEPVPTLAFFEFNGEHTTFAAKKKREGSPTGGGASKRKRNKNKPVVISETAPASATTVVESTAVSSSAPLAIQPRGVAFCFNHFGNWLGAQTANGPLVCNRTQCRHSHDKAAYGRLTKAQAVSLVASWPSAVQPAILAAIDSSKRFAASA